ncbi:MAG TPA: DUF4160 domain-containing protein [Pyrinomonadaceae bacterium]|jgi:hypothetical protein
MSDAPARRRRAPGRRGLGKSKRLGYILAVPTVLEEDGFRVMIHLDDHRPAHVHVYKSGLVVINLNNRRTAPSVREVRGMARNEVREALLLVAAHKQVLVRAWRRIHGGR